MTSPQFPSEPPAPQPSGWPSPLPTAPTAAVWPPPPTGAPNFDQPMCVVGFKTLFLRIVGPVSDFRTGSIQVNKLGLTILGKAVPNAELQIPILIITEFLRVWLIAVLLLEYGFRKDKYLEIPWENVQQIGLVEKKRRVCLVFNAPNDKGIVKTFSLAFKLDPGQYEMFVNSVTPIMGMSVGEAKLKSWNSPAIVMFMIVLGIALGVLLVYAAIGFFNH